MCSLRPTLSRSNYIATNRLRSKTVVLISSFLLLASFAHAAIDIKDILSQYGHSVVKVLTIKLVEGELVPTSVGSGFFVTDDGVIFTDRQAIEQSRWGPSDAEGMGEIVVQAWNTEQQMKLYIAKVDYYSPEFNGTQISLVSDIEGKPITDKFPPIELADSDSVLTGEEVVILGFAYQEFEGTAEILSSGLTVTRRIIRGFDHQLGLIKSDAPFERGNEGAPAFNEAGKVIGVATVGYKEPRVGIIGGINGMFGIASEHVSQRAGLVEPGRPFHPAVIRAQEKVYTSRQTPMPAIERQETESIVSPEEEEAPSAVTVSGIITSADSGQPVNGAFVGLAIMRDDRPEILSSGMCNRNGEFQMAPTVNPGKYTFIVVAEKYLDVVEDVDVPDHDWRVKVSMSRK